jgi:hypothetical protein
LDDDALKSGEWKRVVGAYLVRAKYIVIDFLKEHSTITTKDELEDLRQKLLEAAKETDVLYIPTYRPLPVSAVAKSIRLIKSATQPLAKGDSAQFLSDVGNVYFNLDLSIASESFLDLVTREIISNRTTMILKVKKPDFLGESMWQFRFEDHPIEAKVLDSEWLRKFKDRSVILRPGDAIKAVVESEVRYGFDGDVVSNSYKIIEVLEIIAVDQPTQEGLF